VTFLRRRDAELAVDLRNVTLAQKPVGFLHPGDPRQAQLLRQPPLPGAKASLSSTARLGRIGGDHLDPRFFQRPPDLGQALPVRRPPACGVSKKWLARLLYSAQKHPFVSTTSFSAAMTVRVDSSCTN